MDWAGMDVMMGFGPLAALGVSLGGSLFSKLLNRGNEKRARAAQGQLGQAAEAEAALNRLTEKELRALFKDISQLEDNPIPAFTFAGFQEDPQGFMDLLHNMAGINMRQGLLSNRGIGSSAAGQLAGLTEQSAQSGAAAGGDLVSSLVSSLLLNQFLKGPSALEQGTLTGGFVPRINP